MVHIDAALNWRNETTQNRFSELFRGESDEQYDYRALNFVDFSGII